MNSIFDTIFAIEKSDDLASVQHAVRAVSQPLGFDRLVLFSASPSRDEVVETIYWVEGDWFGEGETVDARTYVRRCPVTRHVFETDEPFFWTKTVSKRGETYRVVRSPEGAGIHGLQVPIFGRAGLEGAMSFGGKRIDGSVRTRVTLMLVGAAAFRSARRLIETRKRTRTVSLSPREREVLRWIAAGRRQADIAVTLGLSERTVENHLRRIRLRLSVATTAQAVRVAIQAGEIDG